MAFPHNAVHREGAGNFVFDSSRNLSIIGARTNGSRLVMCLRDLDSCSPAKVVRLQTFQAHSLIQ